MVGYYIHFDARKSIGIANKIDMQLNEFAKSFDMNEVNVRPSKRSLAQRVIGLLPWISNIWEYDEAFCRILQKQPDFIYIRRTVADRAQINFLKKIKRTFPKCKIIIEVFKYPYDRDEYLKCNSWPFYIKDVVYRNNWKKYVDYILTFSKDKMIFGIPVISTMNGIDTKKIHKRQMRVADDTIDLLAVAYMQHQHAYERILKGMGAYYQNGGDRKILLHMVGNGPDVTKYKKIVSNLKLENRVLFYGVKTGRELDEIYDKCDIGIGALGLYKDKVYVSSALKTREYLAKGLPIVTGCVEDIFENQQFDYYLEFPNDSSQIDMSKIISFYDEIYSRDLEVIASDVYEFALKNAGMDKSLAKLVGILNNNQE